MVFLNRLVFSLLCLPALCWATTNTPVVASAATGSAKFDDPFYAQRPATIDCVMEAATKQGVAVNVLLALASIEGGKNGQWVKNSNGSYDIGHFQINTIHWKRGGAFYQHPEITPLAVANRGCYNAELSAWLLNRAIHLSKKTNYWNKAADYHSATWVYNQVYARKLVAYSKAWGDWLKTRYPQQVAISYQQR